nr:nuclear pore complex protein DDB_G0274915-like [Paramormyrops kingsleyae]
MNGTIQRALSKLVNKRPEEWDNHLDAVMFGLRTKCQVTTKYSPFFLMFGREARYPSQIPSEYRVDSSVEDNLSVEEVTEGILKLDEVLQAAITNTSSKQSKQKKRIKETSSPAFHVGMKVWRLNVRSQQRKGGKLDPNYLGPYTITAIVDKSADLLDSQGVTIPKINTDHLIEYKEEHPRVPRKCSLDSPTTLSGPPNTTTSSVPSTTSSVPSTTSSAPSTTSSGPSTTSAAPSTTSAAPSTTSAAPSTTSSGPSTTSAAPSTTSAAPSTTSAALSTTSSGPSTTSSETSTTSSGAPTTTIPGQMTTTSTSPTVDPLITNSMCQTTSC